QSVEDGLLGFLVEHMHLVQIESDLDAVAGFGNTGGFNASGNGVAFAVQIQIGFSAHQFGNFHVSLCQTIGSLFQEVRLVMYILGTDAEHNVLTHISSQIGAGSLVGGNLNGAVAEGQGQVIAGLANNSVDEVHL